VTITTINRGWLRTPTAFANLQSYGIAARPCLDQTAETAHEDLRVELKATFPHGLGSYVFWLAGDEVLFSSSGDLMDGTELPLHYSTEDVVPGVIAACGDVDIEVVRRSHQSRQAAVEDMPQTARQGRLLPA
jgi:hypothetical protein